MGNGLKILVILPLTNDRLRKDGNFFKRVSESKLIFGQSQSASVRKYFDLSQKQIF